MRAWGSDGEREGEVKSTGGIWERWGGKARAQERWKGSGTESEGVEKQSRRESRKNSLRKLQAAWHRAASAPSIGRRGWQTQRARPVCRRWMNKGALQV